MTAKPTVTPTEPKQTPPIGSYSTFRNFLADYKQAVPPSRIDSSVLRHMGGGIRQQHLQSLRFFNLIDESNTTQDSLVHLVKLDGEERQKALREMFKKSYGFIFNAPDFDIMRATESQLRERFEGAGLVGESARKAKTFFLNAATDANIPVSQAIQPPKKRSPSKGKRQTPPPAKHTPASVATGKSAQNGSTPPDELPLPADFRDSLVDLMMITKDAANWTPDQRTLFLQLVNRLVPAN